MHCGVHIKVGDNPMWRSGVSDDSGHKCHWNNKHVDIDSKFLGQTMKIQGMDYDKKKGQIVVTEIGSTDIALSEFFYPCSKSLAVFHLNKKNQPELAGFINFRSEFIETPIVEHPIPRNEEHF